MCEGARVIRCNGLFLSGGKGGQSFRSMYTYSAMISRHHRTDHHHTDNPHNHRAALAASVAEADHHLGCCRVADSTKRVTVPVCIACDCCRFRLL